MQTNARKARFFRRFLRDRQGASMIELAFAFPVFLLMIIGVIELAMLMFIQVTVEGGLRQASRFGITGQDPGVGTTREEKIAEIVSRHAYSLVEIRPSDIELLVYENFSSIGKPEPYIDADRNDGDFDVAKGDQFIPEQHDKNGNGVWDKDRGDSAQGAGTAGAVVLYRVNFAWDFLTPLFSAAAGANSVDLEAAVAVRNEPWPEEG